MKRNNQDGERIGTVEGIPIGNTGQWISIRTNDRTAPILLFLHGGPGTAQISFSRKSQIGLEDDFVVVNWDQRGAGKSFSSKIKKEEMTIERFVLDAEELAEYLLDRFGQKKLFIIGHSWGSILGMKLTAKRPDLIHAYIGIRQVVNMKLGEEISYRGTIIGTILKNISLKDISPGDIFKFIRGVIFSLSVLEKEQLGIECSCILLFRKSGLAL